MMILAAKPALNPSRASTTRRSISVSALFVSVWLAFAVVSVEHAVGQESDAIASGPESPIVTFRGQTMGTTYMVKLYDPPKAWLESAAMEVDAELRRVNDQMSTYLESSEISRFNRSESTDWFDVSSETAQVVAYSLEVSRKTKGAFDVTVGPLVNLWSFGPEKRTWSLPDDADIAARLQSVGYEQISSRLDPPAIRKSNPKTQIDLSAIAKGHGVDRITELANDRGAANVFVEIGGEVRVTGDKNGDAWVVGIQKPDSENNSLLVRHPLRDEAMATSGDYRNRFEVDGQFYSHTIDPRSGRPITHGLASVTVVANDCMTADAWATAIDVLGPDAGFAAAKENGLDVLMAARRQSHGNDGAFQLMGTGSLEKYVTNESAGGRTSSTWSRLAPMLVATLVMFGVVLAAMAIGVIFGRRPISGSCGGLAGTTNDNGTTRCSVCSNPVDGCKELRDRMQNQSTG